jgi:A/G-specific adenine glycosylase
MSPEQFQQRILSWFAVHGRHDLPWQQEISPYRVWLSETMLQQTQVSSVIPYFKRFIGQFPTLQSLAEAELDTVLQFWSGLGYYARARNLHKTAQLIWATGGKFPDTLAELMALPGIGRSTAGAILSIACGQSQPILDGNVKRVLARFHAISGWTGNTKVAEELWSISQRYTPLVDTAAYTQAMMDMGATLCTRSKPKCDICPLASDCQALVLNRVKHYPEPKPRKHLPTKQSYFLILQNTQHEILMEKRPPIGIWGGLWSLPEFTELAEVSTWCAQQNLVYKQLNCLEKQNHSFSHYHLEYIPVVVKIINPINNVMEVNSRLWYKAEEIKNLGLPSPIKRLLMQLHTEENYDTIG